MNTPETQRHERIDQIGTTIAKSLPSDVSQDIQTRLDFARSQAVERARVARMQAQVASQTQLVGVNQLAQHPKHQFAMFAAGMSIALAAVAYLVYSHHMDDDEWVPFDTPASWVADQPEQEPDATNPAQQE